MGYWGANHRLLLLFAGLGLILLAGLVPPVKAHTEGKMQLAATPAGPFKLTVWTSPDPAEVGEIHVAAAVVLAEDASPILGADVLIELTPIEGEGEMLSALATAEDATNKFLYEAVFEVSETGMYRVNLTVAEDEGPTGEASFLIEVTSPSGFNWWLLIPVALGLGVVAFFLFGRWGGPSQGDD
jgi:hypothetical protein